MRPLLLLASIAAVSAQPAVTFLRGVAPIGTKAGGPTGPGPGAAVTGLGARGVGAGAPAEAPVIMSAPVTRRSAGVAVPERP